MQWSAQYSRVLEPLNPVGDAANTSGAKNPPMHTCTLLEIIKDASKNIQSKAVNDMASNRDLSKFPFEKPGKVLAKQDGNRN